jgi:hypothetical protein
MTKALALADYLDNDVSLTKSCEEAAAELRRQHERITELEIDNKALAGKVTVERTRGNELEAKLAEVEKQAPIAWMSRSGGLIDKDEKANTAFAYTRQYDRPLYAQPITKSIDETT